MARWLSDPSHTNSKSVGKIYNFQVNALRTWPERLVGSEKPARFTLRWPGPLSVVNRVQNSEQPGNRSGVENPGLKVEATRLRYFSASPCPLISVQKHSNTKRKVKARR